MERMAILRVYGLMREGADGKVGLSDIGRKIVNQSDPDGQRTARRQAVMFVKPLCHDPHQQ